MASDLNPRKPLKLYPGVNRIQNSGPSGVVGLDGYKV